MIEAGLAIPIDAATNAIDRVWINKGCRLKRISDAPNTISPSLAKSCPERYSNPCQSSGVGGSDY